jgi:uncharacterized protein YcgI (DUF1989 family)
MSMIVPARYGRAVALQAGQALKVTNIHGNQVVDTWAFHQAEPAEYMSMAHTRSFNSRIYVAKGDPLVSERRRPLLHLEEDTSPGRHDILLCACNLWIYRAHGVQTYHRSCADNMHEALREVGVTLPFTPSPLNLFMNVPVTAEGALDRVPPVSKPGDYVVLRAAEPVYIALSACPQDITAVNGGEPTDVEIEVLG